MNWQTFLYCFSFGTLMAAFVMGIFGPFCRKREAVSLTLDTSTAPPAPEPAISPRLHAEKVRVEKKERAEKKPRVEKSERVDKTDRMSHAIRQWTSERADADLAYVAPPPVIAPEPEPIATPDLTAVLVERSADPPPPTTSAFADEAASKQEERSVAEHNPFLAMDFSGAPNFYEVLQISPRADIDTIHRVYRIMAARFHPDNPVSGDHEMFLKLGEAYEVLSRPERREMYDRALSVRENQPIALFGAREFVDGLNGEMNRRFGILALLYQRRRTNSEKLGISGLELESRMSIPREHLEFTLWYLRSKGLVQMMEENSDYAVTAAGVDYVEQNSERNPILRELLTAGTPVPRPSAQSTQPAPRRHARPRADVRRLRRDGVSRKG
jgi:hypothetical protein